MYSRIMSAALRGIEAEKILVETDIALGFPAFSIVGLPDTAIRESKERVRSALVNSGFRFPDRRVTVNLSPAGLRKVGTHYDLPIALCILASGGMKILPERLDCAFIGELALDGRINRISGVLPMVTGLRDKGIKSFVVPADNMHEASMVRNADVYCAATLGDVVAFVRDGMELPVTDAPDWTCISGRTGQDIPDFSDVSGQEQAKRALQIAAAAMHNVIMVGPPGSGKTMLARRLPGIMPSLSYEEAVEVTKIYSISGRLSEKTPMIVSRPFRSPDHTISPTALTGGGVRARAGEVSLAHTGVLFLDELPQFSRASLESLRKPIEDEEVTISRLTGSITLPSSFLTVAAMNPCPCGYLGHPARSCSCSEGQIRRYLSRLSGPFLDRIDMCVSVDVPGYEEIHDHRRGISTGELSAAVMRARRAQEIRFRDDDIRYNSQMKAEHIRKYCRTDRDTEKMLRMVFEKMKLSARSYDRILKVARTIADLEGRGSIAFTDVTEAVQYKCGREMFEQAGAG